MEKIILNLLPLLLLIIIITISMSSKLVLGQRLFGPVGASPDVRCLESERRALVKFKGELFDDYGRLSSWGTEEDKTECCAWDGVMCDSRTNHVTRLNLRSPTKRLSDTFEYPTAPLKGSISPSLIGLKNLSYLDLSLNDFGLSHLGDFICSLDQLQYLNLSRANFSGPLPHCIGNLSKLLHLDFHENMYLDRMNLDWISNLQSLKYLDLSWTGVNGFITNALDAQMSLEHLDLSFNFLQGGIPKSIGNMSTLIFLDLKGNYLDSQLSKILENFSLPLKEKLQYLDLSYNMISGQLPDFSAFSSLNKLLLSGTLLNGSIEQGHLNIPHLITLDLSSNNITGTLPDFTFSPSLQKLYLHNNSFTGSLGKSFGRLTNLDTLQLRSNRLKGVVTEVHLLNLSHLQTLDMSFNKFLVLNCSPNWIPPFNLSSLALSEVEVGPSFPPWLRFQKDLKFLEIPSTKIADTIPNWFVHLVSTAAFVNASNNQIGATFNNAEFSSFNDTPMLTVLDLSSNSIEGSVSFLCRHGELSFLDLSDNLFSSHLPDCFANITGLWFLNLANNRFFGEIPYSLGLLSELKLLHLQQNGFSGGIPASMMNYTKLQTFDLAENTLSGEIPTGMGDNFPSLIVLSLRSNGFHGIVPSSICGLRSIRILDLSSNNISGSIPECISNLSAMIEKTDDSFNFLYFNSENVGRMFKYSYDHLDGVSLIWKGSERNYVNGLQLVKMIDLSNNSLQGQIPREITKLVALVQLNLSRNGLSGEIPRNIGELKNLDSLDLSRNSLFGSIPSSLSEIGFLGFLNLSYNNLSGKVPPGLKFVKPSYLGNSQLCSRPILDISCPGDPDYNNDGNGVNNLEQEEEVMIISRGFYICMIFGFIIGFWGSIGMMLYNKYVRFKCFGM